MNKIHNDSLNFTMKVRVNKEEALGVVPLITETITKKLQKGMIGLNGKFYKPGIITTIETTYYDNMDVGAIIHGYSTNKFIDLDNDIYCRLKYMELFKVLSRDFNKDIEVFLYDPYIKMEKHLSINKIDTKYREFIETNIPVEIINIDYRNFSKYEEFSTHCNNVLKNLLQDKSENEIYIKGDYFIVQNNKNIIRDSIVALNLKEIKKSTNCKVEDIFIKQGSIIIGGLGYSKNTYRFSI